jgi:ABC-2 type transport system permease protein
VHKLWLVAWHEYRKRVSQRSFLVAMLGIPVLIAVIGGVSILVSRAGADARPIGYVDQAGILNPDLLAARAAASNDFTEMIAYQNQAGARTALEAGDIQAFYVVPEDYMAEKRVSLIYGQSAPDNQVRRDFSSFVRASLLDDQPAEVAAILNDGYNLVVRSQDGRRVVSEGNILGLLLPFVVTFFLFFAIATAGGYLLQAVTEEKENRVVEIITTSISPEQLMGGKALGLMAVSLTQILVWTLALGVGVVIAMQFFEEIGPLAVPWPMLGITGLFFVPTFLLIAGMMTSIGATSTELQQAQQISGIVNLLFMVPMFFVAVIFAAPNSPFLIILTLFPTTAFLTILLRWSLAFIPPWQMVASWALLVTTAITSVWLASRIFRMGMLRYGQRLSLKHIVTGLRERRIALAEETSPHA